MDELTNRAALVGINPAAFRLLNIASSDLKRLWRDVVEHGGNAASLFSPDMAAMFNNLAAIGSLLTLVISLIYAISTLSQCFKSQRK